MRSRTCSSVSSHSFHAYTTSGRSLGPAIASASASILALSFSICGLVTIGPVSPLWMYDHEKNLKVCAAVLRMDTIVSLPSGFITLALHDDLNDLSRP